MLCAPHRPDGKGECEEEDTPDGTRTGTGTTATVGSESEGRSEGDSRGEQEKDAEDERDGCCLSYDLLRMLLFGNR